MSLLSSSMETFIVVNTTIVSDGLGGTDITYTEGIEILGAMPFDNSTQMKIAQAMGAKSTYTLTVRKNVVLDYHTILKRKRDGLYFRLTSGTEDKQTPPTAGLDMRQYTAESFVLGGTNGQTASIP